MSITNLADIQQINKTQQPLLFCSPKPHPNRSEYNSIVATNFHLVMRQQFLELPVEPLLNNHPQIAQWVSQVQEIAPELFPVRKKLLVDNPVIAPLVINGDNHFIQVLTNIAFKQSIPRLYEWAVRRNMLSWQDRVKLWTTAMQYSVSPDQLQLVILALHPVKKAQRINIRWSKKYHQQTERWLIQLLNQPRETELQTPAINSEILSLIDLEAIPEVKL
jgi:hypothetical protein